MPTATEHMIEHPSEHLKQGLATAVEGAIWSFDPIRQTNAMLNITADGGVVTLAGNIRTDTMRDIAGRLARTVPGVLGVNNRFVTDTDIENQAALAMAMDPGLEVYTDRVSLKSFLGAVNLTGLISAPVMADAEAKSARAEALVRAVPGVHSVLNRIQAVEGAGDVAAAAPEESTAGVPAEGQAAMQERLGIWRERARAAAKLP
jgi:osmotically-inducible protein OsmY